MSATDRQRQLRSRPTRSLTTARCRATLSGRCRMRSVIRAASRRMSSDDRSSRSATGRE